MGQGKTIGLIGGTGGMGQMFARLWQAQGHTVLVAGRATPLSYEALVEQAQVVVVTVPIVDTVPVIRRIAPVLRAGQLLTDFTSVKGGPVAAMLDTPADVIGCHPIFGPMAHPAGQNVVLCPQRPGPWLPWFQGLFEADGMRVTPMTPGEHDRAMAVIQGLTHFIHIAFARTLQAHGANMEHILSICSPVYRVSFAMLSRILSGDPALYGQIQTANPENLTVLREFLAASQSVLAQVENGDLEAFYASFNQAAAYLGDYKKVAREESDLLVERMAQHVRGED